ncbi:hypothetical protein BDD12DRAFT_884609 [Trichophaea hybrida]|nr:hypothetical protein BDD12DRAFT_884609 [Trichophaea hybrida]
MAAMEHWTLEKGASPTVKVMITSTSIPSSQLSAITIPSTYNGQSDLTPECGHIENQGEVRQIPTLASLKKPNRGGRIIDNDEDTRSDDESDHDDNTSEHDNSSHNNHEPTAPRKINLEEMVERQQKMIGFLSSRTPNYSDEEYLRRKICLRMMYSYCHLY